jgi:uncharacterized protein YndB with AHSA1/START domain
MEKIYEIYIKTSPEKLWEAITDPTIRGKYNFGAGCQSTWEVGAPYELSHPRAPGSLATGTILESNPPNKLVHTMVARWVPEVVAEGESRVTWEIEPVGDSCSLILTHDQLNEDANSQIYGGWPMILSGLKTWLESGDLLTTPGSLLYS